MATLPNNVERVWAPQAGSQELFMSCPIFEVLYEGTRGPGKGLANTTPILTNKGWKSVEEITYSDLLLAPDGTWTPILGIFPQGEKSLYKVTFDDGQEILCDDVHRWTTLCPTNGPRDGWRVRDTEWLYHRVKRLKERGKRGLFQIPRLSAPAPGLKWEGPDPYIIGLLLGDGTYNSNVSTPKQGRRVHLYSADQETVDYVTARGWSTGHYKSHNSVHMCWPTGANLQELLAVLPAAKRHDKSIPQELLEADPETRLAVVQGLIDSDGCVDTEGRVTFTNTSEHLMKGLQYLVRSLGGKMTYTWHERTTDDFGQLGKWRGYLTMPNGMAPIRLTRKAERVKPIRQNIHRAIVDIQPCGTGETTCFAVEHHSHQFVIDGFVITHNTDALLMDFLQHVGTGLGPDWRGILFRRSHPELADVIAKSQKWFKRIFPGAEYNKVEKTWTFPDGEQLLLRHIKTVDDYWNYHGHAYPWIGWEELTNWADDAAYRKMMSCCRSSNKAVPKKYRATCNPYGCVRRGEVLTEFGWVPIQDFVDGTRVLSVQQNGVARMSEATLVQESYAGHLVQYKTSRATMEFTEGHRLPQVQVGREGFVLRPYSDLPKSEARIKSAADGWEGEDFVFELPSVQTRKLKLNQPRQLTSDDFAILMGWYLSEGCTVERDKAFTIAQTKHRALLEEDLDRLGFIYSRQGTQVTVCSPAWFEYLLQFGKSRDKFIPSQLMNAPTRVLRLLLDRLMRGDGHWTTNRRDAGLYASYSPRLRDQVAEICLKLGYRVRTQQRSRLDRDTPEYSVSFTPPSPFQLRPKVIGGEHFEGEVYCLNVPGDETFFIRQDGCIWLSGNTGHNWVKRRFRLPGHRGIVIRDARDSENELEPPRVAIHGNIYENKILLDADPSYIPRLRAAARNPSELRAWMYGDWDIVAGGMFDDVWNPKRLVFDPFPIPATWQVNRSFDWGSSRPFSVGWWAESDGTTVELPNGRKLTTVRGDLFRIAEWYGCDPREPNTGLRMTAPLIAKGIAEREAKMLASGLIKRRVSPGPADNAIWDSEPGVPSTAIDMEAKGIAWTRSDKSPGSRKQGWLQIRKMLEDGQKPAPREAPGLFIFRTCHYWLDLVPVLPRDDHDLDDVDTDSEDHIGDETRYRVRAAKKNMRQGNF